MKKVLHGLFLLSLAIPFTPIPSTCNSRLQSPVSISMEIAKNSNRRVLHQPLYPIGDSPESNSPFFSQTPPPPPSEPDPDQQNTPTSTSPVPPTRPKVNPIRKIVIVSSVSISMSLFLSALAFLLYRYRTRYMVESVKISGSDSGRFPPSTSNVLYLGTIRPHNRTVGNSNRSPYHRLNRVHGEEALRASPELRPLPPLVGENRRVPSSDLSSDVETLFYTPQDSIEQNSESSCSATAQQSLGKHTSNPAAGGATCGSIGSTSIRASPETSISNCRIELPSSLSPSPPWQPPRLQQSQFQFASTKTTSPAEKNAELPSSSSPKIDLTIPISVRSSRSMPPTPPPAPPPLPPLPAMLGKTRPSKTSALPIPVPPSSRPQVHMPASATATTAQDEVFIPVAEANEGGSSVKPLKREDIDDGGKPRLKPLHWDKVRGSSDRAMVWDQLKTSSFQLNEDRIETLFVSSTSKNPVQKEANRRTFLPQVGKEERVLDPKKSQNIAIILRAVNVTLEEVSEALLDGNPEGLGAELLETLVKMAPTKEEELKLKNYNGDISKLGSAERFLKALLDIPFAFKRIDVMLYRENFDTEVKYLQKSFETLEAACKELKNSRLFLKLLEAVLHTGNRMNVGTNRGEAKAFRLDTLLKLADIKGTDGKTTLLHFVVQEITRSEALDSDILACMQRKGNNDEFKKQALQVVAALSTELGNVRKAAGVDPNALSGCLSKLITGLEKIKLNLHQKPSIQEGKFFESMNLFLKKAEDEIIKIKARERIAFSHVKETTEYFHGDCENEEAHPFRIFIVVRDFLLALDQACKDVGRMHDRTIVGSVRSFRIPAGTSSLPVFNRFSVGQDRTSSDEDSSSSL